MKHESSEEDSSEIHIINETYCSDRMNDSIKNSWNIAWFLRADLGNCIRTEFWNEAIFRVT